MRNIIASFTAAAALLAAVPASAAQDPAARVSVSYGDLDLNTKAGRDALDRRVANATETVCGSYSGTDQAEQDRITQCRKGVHQQVAEQTNTKIRVAAR